MIKKKLQLIDEQTSPLFRIMWVHDVDQPEKRKFENNICAFHVGNGFILSVAHNLRTPAGLFRSISEDLFQNEILPQIAPEFRQLFNNSYIYDSTTKKRYGNIANNDVQTIINELRRIKYDTRWITLTEKNICNPFLIIQFRNNQFYNSVSLTNQFTGARNFDEPAAGRHTFLIELELIHPFYNEDIALYKVINTPEEIINTIPSIEIDYQILDNDIKNFACIQSSTADNLGRLLNDAHIEGIFDHWNVFRDIFGGNYFMEGLRYLIKGYFRFGSSGAPYVVFDEREDKFKVNAIQSEASPIQLTINNKRDGNFQYINAIASPLNVIQEKLEEHLRG